MQNLFFNPSMAAFQRISEAETGEEQPEHSPVLRRIRSRSPEVAMEHGKKVPGNGRYSHTARAKADIVPDSASMGNKRILVVDDDTIICKLLSTYLERNGYEAHVVYSGEDALKQLDRERFHAVITDLKMGGVSGQDVIRRVKQLSPPPLVMMITGSCNNHDEMEAYENGVDEFLFKPFKMNDILRWLQNAEKKGDGGV